MSARTGVFPPPFESASRHAHDALSFLQWLSSFDGRGNRHTGDRHHPRVNRIRAPQHLFKHPLWVPSSLRWTSTSLHPADGLTRGQHSSRARRGAHGREIPIRTTPYLATAFSTPLTFTATSMKLSEPGFSIPLTIAYSRPSCPTNFLPDPDCEIAERVSRASLFLSNATKLNLPYLRLDIRPLPMRRAPQLAPRISRKVGGPPGCVPRVVPAVVNSDASFCPGWTAHDGLLAVMLQSGASR